MTYWAVDVNLFDRKGLAYRRFGEYDGTSMDEAFAYASKRVAAHANAAAQILMNGDPYAWVSNDTTDYAGTVRRDTSKPQLVKYVGGGMSDSDYI